MSGHNKCRCEEKTSLRNPKNMRVTLRNGNYSQFESPKGAFHHSRWSSVVCLGQEGTCPMSYRIKDVPRSIPDLQSTDIHWMNGNTSQNKKR